MKNKQFLNLLLVAVGIAAVIAYWDKIKLWFRLAEGKLNETKNGKETEVTAPDGTKTTVPTASQSLYRQKPSGNVDFNQNLKRGVTSPAVWELQKMLLEGYGKQLVIDGIFGSNTETALKAVTGKTTITLSGFNATYKRSVSTAGATVGAAVAAGTGFGIPTPSWFQ